MDNPAIPIFVATLIVFNLPIYRFLFRKFFGSWGNFWEAWRLSEQNDFLSWMRGELYNDQAAGWLLGLFFVLCGGLLVAEYSLAAPFLEFPPLF